MKKIAMSRANFEDIIKHDFIYVDKTRYLYEIVSSNEPYYFLSRPRRFGKTLFLDTLKTFFEGKKDLFKGLYVYDQEWDWEEYPIVKLDFNEIESKTTKIMSIELKELLDKNASKYGVELEAARVSSRFNELVKKINNKYNKRVVILIDEYDKPIITHLGKDEINIDEKNLDIAGSNQEFMKNFYDNLKSLESYLRLVFITGVSKFSKVSIFSTLNNLIELDMHPKFYTMLGYTEEELRVNFSNHFKQFAEKLNIDIEELIDRFKFMYNGFRFSDEKVKVYNPYSVGKALDYKKIDNYWFESGTPSFLVDLLKKGEFDITNIENIEVDRSKLKAYDITKLKIIPMLFQTGYLTIKDIEDGIIYRLGYPNHEVERGLSQNLLESITEEKISTPIIHRIKKSLMNKDYDKFMTYMKSLFANIANINVPKDMKEREHFYHTIFYLTAVLFSDDNLGVYSELLTSEGRIDMVVETNENIYIIEFKCNQDSLKAIKQIKEKNYSKRFQLQEKEIVLIGINFNTEERNISEFEIAK